MITIDLFKYEVTYVVPGDKTATLVVIASEYDEDSFADGTPSVVWSRDTGDADLKVFEVAAARLIAVKLLDDAALRLADDIFDQDLFNATEPVEIGSISLLRPVYDGQGKEVGHVVVTGPIHAGPLTEAVQVPEPDAEATADVDPAPVGAGDGGAAGEPSERAQVKASGPDGGPCGCGGDDCGQRSG